MLLDLAQFNLNVGLEDSKKISNHLVVMGTHTGKRWSKSASPLGRCFRSIPISFRALIAMIFFSYRLKTKDSF
jgi:hypothetical protein